MCITVVHNRKDLNDWKDDTIVNGILWNMRSIFVQWLSFFFPLLLSCCYCCRATQKKMPQKTKFWHVFRWMVILFQVAKNINHLKNEFFTFSLRNDFFCYGRNIIIFFSCALLFCVICFSIIEPFKKKKNTNLAWILCCCFFLSRNLYAMEIDVGFCLFKTWCIFLMLPPTS